MGLREFLQCDLVWLCLLLLFGLGVVAVVVWGIVGTVRLIAAWAAGRRCRIRPRRLLTAAAVVVVPLCLFELATWHPELSERALQGLTASEVIERAGDPHYDSRKEPDSLSTDDFRLSYHRGVKCYNAEFHNDRVVKVVSYYSDK